MSNYQKDHFSQDALSSSYIKILSSLSETKQYLTSITKNHTKIIRELDWISQILKSHISHKSKKPDLAEISITCVNDTNIIKQYNETLFIFNTKLNELSEKCFSFLSKSSQFKQELSLIVNKQLSYKEPPSSPIKQHNGSIICNNNPKITVKSIKHLRNGNGGSLCLNTSPTHHTNSILNPFKRIQFQTAKIDLTTESNVIDTLVKKKSNFKHSKVNTMDINRVNTFTKGNTGKKIYMKRNIVNNNVNNNVLHSIHTTHQHNKTKSHHGILTLNTKPSLKSHSNSPMKPTSTSTSTNTKLIKHLIILQTPDTDKYTFAKTKMLSSGITDTDILHKDFNIFKLKSIIGHDNTLPVIAKTILRAFNLIDSSLISTHKLDAFLYTVSTTYLKSTLYHNSLHGADVTQTIALYFSNSHARSACELADIDMLSIFIAALAHDIAHPGLTNSFQVNSRSEMAITYHDASCLENFHIATLYKVLVHGECCIFNHLKREEYDYIRRRIVGMILATDMALHGKVMGNVGNVVKGKDGVVIAGGKNKFDEQQWVLDYFIHSADLAHNTKMFEVSVQWVELLSNEFWLQGDKEREMKLPISFLCDRDDCDIPKSQVGFINGFIIPTFEVLVRMFPTLAYTVDNARANVEEWQKRMDRGDKLGWDDKDDKSRRGLNVIEVSL